MTMIEKKLNKIQNEVNKLQERIAKKEAMIQKNNQKCEKLGCADWTKEEFRAKRDILSERAMAKGDWRIEFDDSILSEKQNHVLFEKFICLPQDLEDLHKYLENAIKRLEKTEAEYNGVMENIKEQEKIDEKESSWIAYLNKTPELRKKEYEAWLKWFKAECLKDGVVIEYADAFSVKGLTKSGKKFFMKINYGYCRRSLYCYQLNIDGNTIFTSGLFSTGYRLVRR